MSTAAPSAVFAQSVEVFTTSDAGARLEPGKGLRFETPRRDTRNMISVGPAEDGHPIIGFGAGFSEAGLMSINALSADKQEEVFAALFSEDKGIGMSAMTTPIGASPMSSAGDYFSYQDKAGDVALDGFAVDRDLGENGVATFIKRAKGHGAFVTLASMYYPPDWMLIDLSTNTKLMIHPHHYATASKYLIKYLEAYRKKGIDIEYISPFNEPGNYTKISYSEYANLVSTHFAPDLKNSGLATRLMLGDATLRSIAAVAYPQIFENSTLLNAAYGLTYHGYDAGFDGQNTPEAGAHNVIGLHKTYPDKPLWMSETGECDNMIPLEYGWKCRSIDLPRLSLATSRFWGRQIFSDLAAGASAWSFANAVLDQRGGPVLVSGPHNFLPVNRQQALVHIDRDKKTVTYTGAYYALGHFSKFVRPGSVRLKSEGEVPDVEFLVFERPDGKLVAQAMNKAAEKQTIHIAWNGRTLPAALPAHSQSTFIWSGDK
ncbi:glycoside hydrolase family 30 protein [Sphingopyxis kveilinensis]|uniref:glycoside hydrolase family 30 protein n=1 Tax=Sphingopyxis kveilinensis TaxID=3114367 RepID=UPI0030CCAEF3